LINQGALADIEVKASNFQLTDRKINLLGSTYFYGENIHFTNFRKNQSFFTKEPI